MNERMKHMILNLLPERSVQFLKRAHYARRLRTIDLQEEKDLAVIKYLVGPGDHAVDIGANFGVYTKFLSDLAGPYGHVYSIEPIPQTFDILASNVRRLGLFNVELINCAISGRKGTVTMEVPLFESGVENYYQARIVNGQPSNPLRHIDIASITLDLLFSERPPLVFIKCDVEGHELACIQGAHDINHLLKPAWLIEISGNPDDPHSSSFETFKLLREEGYEPYIWTGERLRLREEGDRSVNYFFLMPKHIEIIQKKGGLIDLHASRL